MKNLLTFLCCSLCFYVSAQDIIPVRILSASQSAVQTYVGTDAFGWQYTIRGNEFIKYNDSQTLKFRALSLGKLSRVDIQNPLQVVLFYKAFNTAVLLDNQLNETARINFSELEKELIAEAVGLASQNRLWIYDINTQQIGLYDLGQKRFKTITPPYNDGIKFYHSDYNYFYWIDSKNNCYRVNLFGSVNSLGIVPAFGEVQIISANSIIYSRDNELFYYNLANSVTQKIKIDEKTFRSFYYTGQILSIFTETDIIQYKIIVPK